MGTKLISDTRTSAGFSLIELLVVIAILAVLSVGAVLTVGRGGLRGEGTADLARFRQSFALMQALAIQGREMRGLVVQSKGLQRARPGPDGWVLSDTPQPWGGRVAFTRKNEAFAPGDPDIRFLPNGRTSAFSIGFATGGRCESDGWTGLTCDAS